MSQVLTIPNIITSFRLVLSIIIPILLSSGMMKTATVVFAIDALLDAVDGYLARKLNQVTEVGKILDPIVDKVMIFGVCIVLLANGTLPLWFFAIALIREIIINTLFFIYRARGLKMQAERWGKNKTVFQSAYIIALILSTSMHTGDFLFAQLKILVNVLSLLAGITTIISIPAYYFTCKNLLLKIEVTR